MFQFSLVTTPMFQHNYFYVAGVIKTTDRKLDRERQAEHILEVSTANVHCNHMSTDAFT
jgi:hypothetical protein